MFQRCYATTIAGMGAVMWQRVSLPRTGGVADQDPWLLSALEHLRDVHNSMEAEAARRRNKQAKDAADSRG